MSRAASPVHAMPGPWWQSGVVYQVYPRSFQDSNGDGVGDLAGIRERLDYLEWLGIDAVWLSPVYRSPMADFGYDVADYTDIDPMFGTLGDLDDLLAGLHQRGMRLVLDFVPNHTSDRHPWFVDSRSGRAAEHRDWYIWRDAAPDGGPPNNWQSVFLGSAWEWDEPSGQYYFHSFLSEQPDLDWTNPKVRQAMVGVLHFWLDRGVDGFRVDVISLLGKGPELQPGDTYVEGALLGDQPPVHDIIAELRAVVDDYDDRLLIGELYLPPERTVAYYGAEGRGIHLPFNFQLLTLDWHATELHTSITRYEEALPDSAWPNWVLSNHDQRRVATRVGPAQARVAAMLLLTLRGTPTLYYGDEIGMIDGNIPRDRWRDPQGRRGGYNRDGSRTPMRWDAAPMAGFTTGEPWLPMGDDVAAVNVAAERNDHSSMLALYRQLLELRRREPALSVGQWRDLGRRGSVLAYERSAGTRRLLIVANVASQPANLPIDAEGLRGRVLISTLETRETIWEGQRRLAPDEALVVLLD